MQSIKVLQNAEQKNITQKVRSRMMASVRNKNTAPEMCIRKALFARGFRYRIHSNSLPGKPDIVLPKYKAVIFINGCFWHKHNCHLFQVPESNTLFWEHKLQTNALRDRSNIARLEALGWRVRAVWLCELKNKKTFRCHEDEQAVVDWIRFGEDSFF